MKTTALNLHHHLTNCMRLLAVMLFLTYTYTATAQKNDTLPQAKPESKWGVGVSFGVTDKYYNLITGADFKNILQGTGFKNTNINSNSYGIAIAKTFNKFFVSLNSNFNNYTYNINQDNTNTSPTPPNLEKGFIKYDAYSISVGLMAGKRIPINKVFSFDFSIGPKYYYISRLTGQMYSDVYNNNTGAKVLENQTDLSIEGGWGVGLCINPAINVKIHKNVTAAFELRTNYLYVSQGGQYQYKRVDIYPTSNTVTFSNSSHLNINEFYLTPNLTLMYHF